MPQTQKDTGVPWFLGHLTSAIGNTNNPLCRRWHK